MILLLPVVIEKVTVRRATISLSPINGYSRLGIGSCAGIAIGLGSLETSKAASSILGLDIISPIASLISWGDMGICAIACSVLRTGVMGARTRISLRLPGAIRMADLGSLAAGSGFSRLIPS